MATMVSSLIGHRHPHLGEILALWQAWHQDGVPPAAAALVDMPPELSAMIVWLDRAPTDDAWRVVASGDAADAAYGAHLAGHPAARLSPGSADSDREAEVTASIGRPLMIENDLVFLGRKARVARLYLPLAPDGDHHQVLWGVAVIEG